MNNTSKYFPERGWTSHQLFCDPVIWLVSKRHTYKLSVCCNWSPQLTYGWLGKCWCHVTTFHFLWLGCDVVEKTEQRWSFSRSLMFNSEDVLYIYTVYISQLVEYSKCSQSSHTVHVCMIVVVMPTSSPAESLIMHIRESSKAEDLKGQFCQNNATISVNESQKTTK